MDLHFLYGYRGYKPAGGGGFRGLSREEGAEDIYMFKIVVKNFQKH